MDFILTNILPTIIAVITSLGTIITVIAKVPHGDKIDRLESQVRVLRKQNADLKRELAEVKVAVLTIARRHKGIKDDVK